MDGALCAGYTSHAMAKHREKGEAGSPDVAPPDSGSEVVLLLCTSDAALQRTWAGTEPPPGFRLETVRTLDPGTVASRDATLVLVDAEAALDAEGPVAETLRNHAARCVWTGAAETINRLGDAAINEAYDVLVTPISPAVLARRLAGWARNIERTVAIESLGQRVEHLAERSNRLSARLAETEQMAGGFVEPRQRLDRALQRIHELVRLSRQINSLDLDQIVAVCVEQLPALFDATRASLYVYDAAGERLILQGHSSKFPTAERVDLRANPHSPMAVAVRSGEPLLIGDFNEFQKTADLILEREFRDHYVTASCVVAPLKGGGRVRGVLNLADKRDGGCFDKEIDLPIIEQVSELIGASIYNVELYQEMEHRAKTDPLTGLANRRGVEEALARETDRARRYGSPLSVMMIDVDQLKDINDRFGHHAGDAALQNLAAVLLETVRSVDVPGRWGGDEFLVILPDTSAEHAEQLAMRLRRRVHDQPTTAENHEILISLSIGVANYQKDESLESLIRRVDQAMYTAKEDGRDRITTAEPPD